MKKFLLFLGLTLAMGTSARTTWFVDNISGNDRNDGTSVQSAFQTIARINILALNPGDSLLFRRGGEWTGNLVPKGNGKEKKRIVIGAYGNGPAPVLDAKGGVSEIGRASCRERV